MEFVDRLKLSASHAGVQPTQSGIAEALGVDRRLVYKWFNGSLPEAPTIVDIAERFAVNVSWLADERGDMLGLPADSGLSESERDLIRYYRKAEPRTKAVIYETARALAKAIVVFAFTVPPLLAVREAIACVLCKIMSSFNLTEIPTTG